MNQQFWFQAYINRREAMLIIKIFEFFIRKIENILHGLQTSIIILNFFRLFFLIVLNNKLFICALVSHNLVLLNFILFILEVRSVLVLIENILHDQLILLSHKPNERVYLRILWLASSRRLYRGFNLFNYFTLSRNLLHSLLLHI